MEIARERNQPFGLHVTYVDKFQLCARAMHSLNTVWHTSILKVLCVMTVKKEERTTLYKLPYHQPTWGKMGKHRFYFLFEGRKRSETRPIYASYAPCSTTTGLLPLTMWVTLRIVLPPCRTILVLSSVQKYQK